MIEIFKIAIELSTVLTGIKILYIFLFTKSRMKKLLGILNPKFLFFEYIVITITFALAIMTIEKIKENNSVIVFFILFIFSSIPLLYNYIIAPILRYSYSRDIKYTNSFDYLKDKYNFKVRICIIESKIVNAFAIGILPFSQTVLISSEIVNKFEKKQLESILFHEIGHIKLNHLVKLLFIQLLFLIPSFCNIYFILPLIIDLKIQAIFVALNGAIFIGLLPLLVQSFFQKRFEFEADSFSTKVMQDDSMSKALYSLNQEVDGAMDKFSFTHPTLQNRINNVNKTIG